MSDIRTAIERIEAFTQGVDTYEQYRDDLKTQSAVERQLGIIGEAAGQYRKLDNAPALDHAQQIAGFRNRIIHAYDSMDHTIIWAILKIHLSPLKNRVVELLEG